MKKLLLVLLIFNVGSAFAQSNKKLEAQGDESMQNGLYSYAVHYYAFILFKIKNREMKVGIGIKKNQNSLKKIFSKNNLKIFIAYYIKKVRIIDNFWLIIKKESTYT